MDVVFVMRSVFGALRLYMFGDTLIMRSQLYLLLIVLVLSSFGCLVHKEYSY